MLKKVILALSIIAISSMITMAGEEKNLGKIGIGFPDGFYGEYERLVTPQQSLYGSFSTFNFEESADKVDLSTFTLGARHYFQENNPSGIFVGAGYTNGKANVTTTLLNIVSFKGEYDFSSLFVEFGYTGRFGQFAYGFSYGYRFNSPKPSVISGILSASSFDQDVLKTSIKLYCGYIF